MAKRSSGKTTLVLVALLAVVGVGLAWFLTRDEGGEAPKAKPAAESPDREMTDQEREDYLTQYGQVEGLAIEPDKREDTGERVPGLLRVRGTFVNGGPRKLHAAFLHVYPKDDAGEVLGSFVENVVEKGGPLDAGGRRDFSFTIPEKKGFGGDFGHTLR